MGLSIQEQLLKAGMVDKKQVKKAEHEKRVQNKKKKKGKGAPAPDSKAKLLLQQQQAEQAKQDQKLNAERKQQAQLKADQAAAKQLIETNKLPFEEGDESYSYVDGGKIKRIFVPSAVADKLAAGKIALARCNNDFVLIPAETAIKVMTRDENAIVIYNDPAEMEDDYPTDW